MNPDTLSAFALYVRKWEVRPQMTPRAFLQDAFMAGWSANDEAKKQGDMFTPAPIDPAGEAPSPLGRGRHDPVGIWSLWPIKKARGAAIAAIAKALKKTDYDTLAQAVKDYADAIATWPAGEKQYVPMCSTWMNQERWADDRSTWQRGPAIRESQYGNLRA